MGNGLPKTCNLHYPIQNFSLDYYYRFIYNANMNTLKNIFQAFWQKRFRKKHYEFKNALVEFSRSLTLIADLEQLKDNIISKIREITKVDAIFIYLFDPDLNYFQIAESRGIKNQDNNKLFLLPDDPLISWFTINEDYLIISDNYQIFSYFSGKEQQIIKELNIDFIFPLIAMNRVTGLICLSPKSTETKFRREEIDMLTTLLGQISLAFENAYLYEQQKSRLKKMYRADRLATLGQLAAGAAHEIRNPLTSIRSTIQYLKKEIEDETKRELMSGLIEEVDRINEIIQGLLSFSKPSKPVKEKIDLEQLLQQSLTLVNTTAKKRKIEITMDFNSSNKYLTADPSQLKQVFLNIIMNALHAMDEGGKLSLSIQLNKKLQSLTSEIQSFFFIIFQDNGKGIPQKDLDHIFDPFFTTKKDGTGLGLSISYGIIQQHRGDIEIESSTEGKNRGTKVVVTLPVG